MKTAFNIKPEIEEIGNLHLLFEAGDYGISCCWYAKNPVDVKGISVYNFSVSADATEKANELEKLLQTETAFSKTPLSTSICYNFRESMPVPAEYYKPGCERDLLLLLFDCGPECQVSSEEVPGKGIYNLHAVNRKMESVMSRHFPGAVTFHASSRQLVQETATGNDMYCTVFHNMVKVILYKDGVLQLLQYFNYAGTTDVAYHLLNSCKQYGISPAEVNLRLCGLIDTGSLLYNELYKYFSLISFHVTGNNVHMHERVTFYPAHYFSHLTDLLPCGS